MTRSLSPSRISVEKIWKLFGEAHKSIYLGSDGRLGSRLAWIPMLLLSTRGRRTGLVRTMPLAYLPDPEEPETCVVVASNGGSDRPPAWWLNLKSNGIATVKVGRESFLVHAELAPEERRSALWSALRSRVPPYRLYERIEREIPIVLLQRVPPGEKVFHVDVGSGTPPQRENGHGSPTRTRTRPRRRVVGKAGVRE